MNLTKIFFGVLLLASQAHAQAYDYTDFAGAVPRAPGIRSAAVDLELGGTVLAPDQADQLRKSKGLDLSLVNPQTSEIWSPGEKKTNVSILDVQTEGETFQYLDVVQSMNGNFRFTVQAPDSNGVVKTYIIFVAKNVHNVLLRRALLMKLGYNVQDVKILKKFKVQFKGGFSRKTFVDQLGTSSFGDVGRWILDPGQADSDTVLLQDAVIVSADNEIYDLSQGNITSGVIRGRRVLNALLVPFNLVDVPESVNLLTWHPGRIRNDMIFLPYVDAAEMNPSYDDARWAARLIGKLKREDFAQIVKAGGMPQSVSTLLLEKVISRRNTLMSWFNTGAPALPFNPNISFGKDLVNGKITATEFPGYGSRFAYGDPLAPLSGSEIRAFAKSRVFGAAIDNAISQFNLNVVPHSDINKAAYDHQVGLAQANFLNFLKTGQMSKTPFGFWTVPTFNGSLIVSRDVITGSYLGTDNLVQLADTFGFSVEGGLFIGTDGLPSQLSVSAQAKLGFVRTYTHIKPIQSIKAAIKEPFRNMAVPILKHDFAKTLDSIAAIDASKNISGDKDAQDARQKVLSDAMTEFTSLMGAGESILITDSLNKLAGASASVGIQKNIDAYASFSASNVVVRRLQIYRKDINTIQVYRDRGDYSILNASVGFDALIPIFTLKLQHKAGSSETAFYELDITTKLEDNPDAITNVKALRSTLLDNNTDAIEAFQQPFQLEHHFKENSADFKFLLWRWLGLETSDQITATAPGGQKKSFLYWSSAKMSGKSYEDLASNVIAKTLEELTGSNKVIVPVPGTSLPGQGAFGSSVSRRTSFESELALPPSKQVISESYIEINYEWKGWEISKADVLKIIKKISDRFSFNFYPPNVLSQTTKIQLYSIRLSMSIYNDGIRALSKVDPAKFKSILIRENKFNDSGDCDSSSIAARYSGCDSTQTKSEFALRKFSSAQKKYFKALADGDANEASKQGLNMVNSVEAVASTKGLVELVGGINNVYVRSSINGFRQNDEGGDTAIISDTMGQVGSAKDSGPLRFVQQNLHMTDSEFFDYWILDKI